MDDIIINFFHLLAAAVWLGGAIFIKVVLNPSLAQIDPQQRGKLMGTAAKRFSITAWISIIVLIITGLLKTPSDMLFDVSSDIGIFLTIKIISVIGVVIIGLIIALKLVPAMRKSMPQAGSKTLRGFH
jgi:putative copper export protein